MNDEERREAKVDLLEKTIKLADKSLKRVSYLLDAEEVPAKDVMNIFNAALKASQQLQAEIAADRPGDKEGSGEKSLKKKYDPKVQELIGKLRQ